MNEKPMEMSGSGTAPLVSVVIPVYNVEKYLAECLDSVIGQTLREIEIICVNDGSTDSSAAIAEEYVRRDSRVKLISQPNGGLSAARNTGMKAAKGEYIYFLDSDDYLTANALEELYRQSKEQELDILYFGAESFYENDELREKHKKLAEYYYRKKTDGAVGSEAAMKMFLRDNSYRSSVPMQFFRRALLEENDLSFLNGIQHEDELFTPLTLCAADKVAVTDANYYQRRVRGDSITTQTASVGRYNGRFTVAIRLLLASMSEERSENARRFLYERAKVMYERAKETYGQLSDWDKKNVVTDVPEEVRFLYAQLRYTSGVTENTETAMVRASAPYRVGSVITWLPRMIRNFARSMKEKGFAATMNTVLLRLHLKKQ